VISELYDGEASFLVSRPFGTRPAHDQAVLLDIKPCNLNRSQIRVLRLMMPDVVEALYGDGPIAVVRHHHFRALESALHWFPLLVNAHEHISGLSGPLVVPDAPTLPLALAEEIERHDRRYKGRHSLDGAPIHPLTSCAGPDLRDSSKRRQSVAETVQERCRWGRESVLRAHLGATLTSNPFNSGAPH
jgi:hypothetical protein